MVEDDRIDASLEDVDSEVQVIVRFSGSSADAFDGETVGVETLEERAASSQEPFKRFSKTTPGVTVEQQFVVANAASVTVDTDAVSLEKLSSIDGVVRIHENFEIDPPDADHSQNVDTDITYASESTDVTWGLERINVPDTWDEYDTKGDGVEVAVLDTGVNADHPDITIDSENWAEFDQDGATIDSEPYDTNGHGTQVSSVVVGSNESGTHIGVAPEATLLHGGVATTEGGTVASILGGIDWAVENDVDVISISLGVEWYEDDLIEPVRNAEQTGTVVVAAAGNDGEGQSLAPANVYESISVGSVTPEGTIRNDSGGERIDGANAWSDPPTDWPEAYLVPDVAAPGEDVLAADADGDYVTIAQTSAATPHVAGAAALLRSADSELTATETRDVVAATATKPDAATAEQDTRYGHGIIDVDAAMGVVADRVTVSGTVTDENGTPLEGVTVESTIGQTATDETGRYTVPVERGTRTITVSGFGIEPTETVVNATSDAIEHDITTDAQATVELVTDAPPSLEPGEKYDLEFRIANVDSYTVTISNGTVENVTLEERELGTETPIDVDRGEIVTTTVVTDPDEIGSAQLSHEFHTADGDSIERQTAETALLPEPITVGDEGDLETIDEAVAVAANGTTIRLLDEEYEIDADDDLTITTPVTLTVADDIEPELSINGSASDSNDIGIVVAADETTVSGLTINGTDLRTGLAVVDADDVQLLENTVEGAEIGIATDTASSAWILQNDIAGEADIGLYASGTVRSIEKNTVDNGVDTGILIDGDAWTVAGNEIVADETAVSVRGAADTITENRFEAHDTDIEITGDGEVRTVSGNEFVGNGTGVAVRDGLIGEVVENRFSGNTGLRTPGTGESSSRNDYSNVNGTAISSDGAVTYSSLDYYGDRGPEADDLDGNIEYSSFLTAPPTAVASADADVEHFGYHLELKANETTAVSFPGSLANDLETTFGEFNGTIHTYNADGEWSLVTDATETPGALDTYVVTPKEDVTVHLEFANETDMTAPEERPVKRGWNLVGAPMVADAEMAYQATTAEPARLLQLYATPNGSPIDETIDEDWSVYSFGSEATDPTVSPHMGYFVYVTEDGSIAANTYSGMTLADFEEAVVSDADSGPSIAGTRSETEGTVPVLTSDGGD